MDISNSAHLPMMGRRPIILFASLLVFGLAFITYLGRTVLPDLEALSTAQHDDVSWRMSQLEIETLNLKNSVQTAIHETDGPLSDFRRRYDIFYSRVDTLANSKLYNTIREDRAAKAGLERVVAFLDKTTPIIDGPDEGLRAALPGLNEEIIELRGEVRALALIGIQVFAKADAARREEFSQTLVKLAASVLALIVILLLAVVVLVKLYRRGQIVSHDNQIVRSRFEAAVSSSLDAVLLVDKSGKIVEFNGAAETVFGYSRAEALGGDMAELIVPPHMRAMHVAGMNRYLQTGEPKVIGAGRVRLEGMRKSGEVFPVELSISLSEAEGERVFVSFLRDITSELQAEEDLRSARDKAQESERAKSDLLTVMSHEMRTPLNGILGSLSLIDQASLNARQRRHMNSISVSGELLLSHVNDVLDLSSLGTDAAPRALVNFDLRDLVTQMANSQTASAERRGNTLHVDFLSDARETVLGSKRSLQQCLVNLVGNAIKFTKDGAISVEVERLDENDLVEIRVSDTGVGIAPENLERIFEEFVTIDTAYARQNAGTGLGLAITKRLVESMGGEIEADSFEGEGSLFTIRVPLPRSQSRAGGVAKPGRDDGQKSSFDHTALVVDDNEINRMILVDMLSDLGCNVVQAADGYEAIQKVTDQRFDFVLLDISMPGIDGIETLQRIRALDVEWRNVTTLAVTAHAARADHDRILKAPFADLLVKPVTPNELRAKLSKVVTFEPKGAEDPKYKTARDQFIRHFGQDKYQTAMATFLSEIEDLRGAIEQAEELDPGIRKQAHKLAGSAAVLGHQDAWTQLQAIESHDEVSWLEAKAERIARLSDLSAADDILHTIEADGP